MEQINIATIYDLGKTLNNCFSYAKLPIKNYVASVDRAIDNLQALLAGVTKYKLDESSEAASALLERLKFIAAKQRESQDSDAVLNEAEVNDFNGKVFAFDQAFNLELSRSPIFYVTPKGVFDTRRLIVNGSAVFEGYLEKIPEEAVNDTDQAARCMAFALATAAGFHIARATEAVIRRQMDVFGCDPIKGSQRNWGNYIRALTDKGANPKILHQLEQLKDLHRNPLIHPEVTLTMMEAQSLWAMCTSAIQAMVSDMETKSASPSSALLAMVPN